LSKRAEIGITAPKKESFSEWYVQVVQKAELADYAPVKGLIVLRPDGYAIWESLQNTFNRRFAGEGVRNGFLPVLIPESLLKKEGEHFEGFNPEVFWVTHSGNNEIGEKLALRPTSETLAYTMYSKWIQSWRDLPLKINFWNTALRSEIKATKPFLRTSEFLWQEGHTVHATQEEAERQVSTMLRIYKETVEEELAIPVISGTKSEREKFVGADYTTAIESIMPDGRALQMGTSHFLARHFSEPFDVKFADRDNVEHFAWQTSWGVSWRLIGAMIMVHGDDRGMIMPPRVAPVQAVIVPIYRNAAQKESVMQAATSVRDALDAARGRMHIDDRDGVTPGYKLNDWEMKGVPLRIEIGPRDVEAGSVIVVSRHDGQKDAMGIDSVRAKIPVLLEEIQQSMLTRATARAEELTFAASDYDEFKELSGRGFVRARWCGGAKCEEKIKEETGVEIRVIPFNRTADDMRGEEEESSRSDYNSNHDSNHNSNNYGNPGSHNNCNLDIIPDSCVYCQKEGISTPIFARGY